jgi:hypothetical protein
MRLKNADNVRPSGVPNLELGLEDFEGLERVLVPLEVILQLKNHRIQEPVTANDKLSRNIAFSCLADYEYFMYSFFSSIGSSF